MHRYASCMRDEPCPRSRDRSCDRFLLTTLTVMANPFFVPPTIPLRQGGREGYIGVIWRGSSLGVGVGVSWLPSRAEVSSVARNRLRLTRRESEVSGCSFCPALPISKEIFGRLEPTVRAERVTAQHSRCSSTPYTTLSNENQSLYLLTARITPRSGANS